MLIQHMVCICLLFLLFSMRVYMHSFLFLIKCGRYFPPSSFLRIACFLSFRRFFFCYVSSLESFLWTFCTWSSLWVAEDGHHPGLVIAVGTGEVWEGMAPILYPPPAVLNLTQDMIMHCYFSFSWCNGCRDAVARVKNFRTTDDMKGCAECSCWKDLVTWDLEVLPLSWLLLHLCTMFSPFPWDCC